MKRLSAHRTSALQAEVARHPHVALVAVVHRLALRVIHDAHYGSPINITPNPQDRLEQYAPDVAEAPAAAGMRQVREAWAERLPSDPDALFAELLPMPQQELLSLLAVCVSFTVTAIASREDEAPAAALALAVGLEMHAWWTPTAAGYFDHVSKAKALEGVQAFAPGEVNRLRKLKKAQISSEAERLAAGTGWLPAMFRAQEVTEPSIDHALVIMLAALAMLGLGILGPGHRAGVWCAAAWRRRHSGDGAGCRGSRRCRRRGRRGSWFGGGCWGAHGAGCCACCDRRERRRGTICQFNGQRCEVGLSGRRRCVRQWWHARGRCRRPNRHGPSRCAANSR